MKILLVGGGGREHALAWKLKGDHPSLQLIAAPGNPGIAELGTCEAVATSDVDGLVALAEREGVSLVVVGPEAPLAAGLTDRLLERGISVFGPTRAAAEIETSKRFSKALMQEAGVPTARAEVFTDVDEARRAVRRFGAPVVIKASGLAAGKGVMVCRTLDEADAAIARILSDRVFGDAGNEILVEEFMEGEELSIFAVTDGRNAVPLLPSQDHKRLLEGDEGPNTGGMGAYAPVSSGTPELVQEVLERVFHPTLHALERAGRPFTGLLYAGLMLTADGPKVVEFNCRFGDPETQAILPLLDSSLLELIVACAKRGSLADVSAPVWRSEYAVTTVVASPGYPERARVGDRLSLPEPENGVLVFHAGTARGSGGSLVSAGGRVLNVTGIGATLAEAQSRSVNYAERVEFAGKQLRRDIGWRDLARQGDSQPSGR